MSSETIIITHVDADGIGSSALVIRSFGKREEYIQNINILYIQPDEVYRTLQRVAKEIISKSVKNHIYITDLAPNKDRINDIRDILKRLIREGKEVVWMDHHLWDDKWLDDLSSSGAKIIVDTSTCATGVVRKNLLPHDPFAIDLEKVICSIDLWKFDDPRASFFTRLVSYKNTNEWRRELINKLITADKVEEVIEWGMKYIMDLVDKELYEYNYYLKKYSIKELCGVKFVALVKEENSFIGTSQLGHYMLSITNSDVAVIIRRNGSVSFRSREYNVRDLAVELGGGGHRLAAGASIKLDPLAKILVKLGFRKILINRVFDAINEVFEKKHICKT